MYLYILEGEPSFARSGDSGGPSTSCPNRLNMIQCFNPGLINSPFNGYQPAEEKSAKSSPGLPNCMAEMVLYLRRVPDVPIPTTRSVC